MKKIALPSRSKMTDVARYFIEKDSHKVTLLDNRLTTLLGEPCYPDEYNNMDTKCPYMMDGRLNGGDCCRAAIDKYGDPDDVCDACTYMCGALRKLRDMVEKDEVKLP